MEVHLGCCIGGTVALQEEAGMSGDEDSFAVHTADCNCTAAVLVPVLVVVGVDRTDCLQERVTCCHSLGLVVGWMWGQGEGSCEEEGGS